MILEIPRDFSRGSQNEIAKSPVQLCARNSPVCLHLEVAESPVKEVSSSKCHIFQPDILMQMLSSSLMRWDFVRYYLMRNVMTEFSSEDVKMNGRRYETELIGFWQATCLREVTRQTAASTTFMTWYCTSGGEGRGRSVNEQRINPQ